jgi:hypothetical protein
LLTGRIGLGAIRCVDGVDVACAETRNRLFAAAVVLDWDYNPCNTDTGKEKFFSLTDLSQGLRILWNPGIILTCQLLWIGIFLYQGRSSVTAARITFFVRSDRI